MLKDEIADQLVYATVKISSKNDLKSWAGTGFFMTRPYADKANVIKIVTNRHVMEHAKTADITLTRANPDGTPNNTEHVTLHFDGVQTFCQYHSDPAIDVCVVDIQEGLKALEAEGIMAYFKCISTNMIVTDSGLESLTPIEDVIMIGYPNAISDTANNRPVVRSGITATDLKLNYNGKCEFMIDMACFPGSSGSPVFLRKNGLEKETNEDSSVTLAIKQQYAFLGILYAGPTITVDGNIVVKDIPTAAVSMAEMQTMMNLGYVIKAEKVLEMVM